MEAQEEEDAEAGGETIETQGMRELAQLPQHQQVRPWDALFCFVSFDALVAAIFVLLLCTVCFPSQVLGNHLYTIYNYRKL